MSAMRRSRMGIFSKLRWPFSQIQKKGGLSHTSTVGATSDTQISAMHTLTALPRSQPHMGDKTA
jgi:hypothetical protein